MKKNLLSLALLIAFCSGCLAQSSDSDWPCFRGTPDLSGRSDSELPESPVLKWSISTGSATKSSPVVSNGVIYFGSENGSIYAVTEEGKIKWKCPTGNPVEAPPLVFQDRIYAGSSDGILRCVNKLTGKLLWNYKTDNQIVGSANFYFSGKKAAIIFGSYDYYLHCVDPVTGKALWKVETENYVNGTPALGNNTIIFGGCDGIVRF